MTDIIELNFSMDENSLNKNEYYDAIAINSNNDKIIIKFLGKFRGIKEEINSNQEEFKTFTFDKDSLFIYKDSMAKTQISIAKKPKILIINYDEQRKVFKIGTAFFYNRIQNPKTIEERYLQNIIQRIKKDKPDLIVCSVQNSLSCTTDHLEHHLMGSIFDDLKKNNKYPMNYSLVSKVEATKKSNSSQTSCLSTILNNSKKPFNCRVRIYGNNDTMDFKFKNEDFKEKSISSHFSNNSNYNRSITEFNGEPPIGKFYIKDIEYRRVNEGNGYGGILHLITVAIKYNINDEPVLYQYMFVNYNIENEKSKILDRLESVNINNPSILSNPFEIFMITLKDIKTRKFYPGENKNIFKVKNGKKLINKNKINHTPNNKNSFQELIKNEKTPLLGQINYAIIS
jgi:hypothetical protein